MSNISSKDTWAVTLMRWVARFVSILWACWALFIAFYVSVSLHQEGHFSLAISITIMTIACLMFMGAAIIASVWGKEAFGGGVLLVDCVLIIASFVIVCFLVKAPAPPPVAIIAFLTLVLPPLVAGSLFLACDRISNTSGE